MKSKHDNRIESESHLKVNLIQFKPREKTKYRYIDTIKHLQKTGKMRK